MTVAKLTPSSVPICLIDFLLACITKIACWCGPEAGDRVPMGTASWSNQECPCPAQAPGGARLGMESIPTAAR
jgi:hypothetical protein